MTGCAALASGYLAVPATTALTAAALAAAFTAATLATTTVTLAFLATAARATAALATAALATTTALSPNFFFHARITTASRQCALNLERPSN